MRENERRLLARRRWNGNEMSAASEMPSASRASSPPWLLPATLSRVFSRLPQFVPSAALAVALDATLIRALDRDALARLEGKVIRLVVRDARLTITLRCLHSHFHPGFADAQADVTIASYVHDFMMLAARREDPDSLFFSRRLTMEGDTELGLVVKNMLDAADLAAFARWFARSEALIGAVRRRFAFR